MAAEDHAAGPIKIEQHEQVRIPFKAVQSFGKFEFEGDFRFGCHPTARWPVGIRVADGADGIEYELHSDGRRPGEWDNLLSRCVGGLCLQERWPPFGGNGFPLRLVAQDERVFLPLEDEHDGEFRLPIVHYL